MINNNLGIDMELVYVADTVIATVEGIVDSPGAVNGRRDHSPSWLRHGGGTAGRGGADQLIRFIHCGR